MAHRRTCGHLLADGRHCGQLVADPSRSDCGRHQPPDPDMADFIRQHAQPNERGCIMRRVSDDEWVCYTHRGPEWETAWALGTTVPCRIPLPPGTLLCWAEHEGTGPNALTILAHDATDDVRKAVAENTSAPPKALLRLVSDPNEEVRRAVANNKCAPADALRRLAVDSDLDVLLGVGMNPSIPEDVAEMWAQDPRRRFFIRWNVGLPYEMLERLANDPDPAVRAMMEVNPASPNAPLDKLREWASDPQEEEWVREAARTNLRRRGETLPEAEE